MKYKQYYTVAIVCFMIAFSSSLLAEPESSIIELKAEDPRWLVLKRLPQVSVLAIGEVEDGCWETIEESENAVKLEFQRSGYELVNFQNPFAARIILKATGYRSNGLCIANYDFELSLNSTVKRGWKKGPVFPIDENRKRFELTYREYQQIWNSSGIVSGPKISQTLKNTFQSASQELLLEIEERQEAIITEAIANSDDIEAKEFWRKFL
ncbi:hypothetical protein [uncultured Idiomarina sp.]|uniref:hypothetical protein n=1 Tax=uncultured Idiomarina sp. TaxID=352961 RepID=UPI0025983DB0|nr:hypothetical protein [uncultured Idiomarina sp.]